LWSATNPLAARRVVALAWVATRLIMLIGVVVARQYCDPEFYKYAGLLAAGKFPYRDFTVEYPPLAVVLLLLPALPLLPFPNIAPRLDPAFLPGFTHLPSPNPTYWGAYAFSFACEMLLIDALTLWLVRHAARRLLPSDPQGLYSGLLYVLLVFASGALLQKFDLVLGTLCLLAVVALVERRNRLGWAALACATLVKGYPALVVPVLAGAYLTGTVPGPLSAALRSRVRPLLDGLLTFGAVIASATLAVALFGGWRPVWDTVTYHTHRGAEIESLYANVMLAVGWVPGLRPRTDFSPADLSRVVRGPLEALAAPASLLFLALLLVGAYASAWRVLYRLRDKVSPGAHMLQPLLVVVAALLLAFELSFLALPAHYLLVLLPLAAVIRLPTWRLNAVFLTSVVLVAVFGQILVVAPVWTSLKALAPAAVLVLSLRNMAWVMAYSTLIVASCQWPVVARAAPIRE
jgi:hypothetical protein